MLRILLFFASILLIAASPPTVNVPLTLQVKEGGTIGVPVCRSVVAPPKTSFFYQTVGDTAVPGVDFVARSGNASIAKNARCYTVALSIIQNSIYSGEQKSFRFQVRITSNGVLGNGETVIGILEDDPVPPPPPPPPPPGPTGWTAAPADGFKGLLAPTRFARAVVTCSSIYRTAETDRTGITFLGVTTGEVYQLIIDQDLPNPGWGYTKSPNIFNQFGNIWTVYPLDQTYDQASAVNSFRTVSQDCLEGVVPS